MQYLCFFALVFCSLYVAWTLIGVIYNAVIDFILHRRGAEKERDYKRDRKS